MARNIPTAIPKDGVRIDFFVITFNLLFGLNDK